MFIYELYSYLYQLQQTPIWIVCHNYVFISMPFLGFIGNEDSLEVLQGPDKAEFMTTAMYSQYLMLHLNFKQFYDYNNGDSFSKVVR